VLQARDKNDKVWLDGNFAIGDRQFSRHGIESITSARAWELFEVVKRKLGPAFSPEECTAGIVLTGGGAKLPAIADCASKVFGTQARLGEAPQWVAENLRDPGYHTALGVLYYGVNSLSGSSSSSGRKGGLLRSFSRLFAQS
jgi:cell division protein FtsA